MFIYFFLDRHKETILRLNLYFVYAFLPFVPIMIPFYKIEPMFICTKADIGKQFSIVEELLYYDDICEKEQICNNEFESMDWNNSYFSFRTSGYYSNINKDNISEDNNNNKEEEIKIKVNCQESEFSLSFLNLFYVFYSIGIILASEIYNRNKYFMEDKQNDHFSNKLPIINILTISSLTLFYLISVFYYYKGMDIKFSLLFLIYTMIPGFFFYLMSTLTMEQFMRLIKISRIEIKNLTYKINVLYCLCGLIHISVFYYTKHWIYNFFIFVFFSFFILLFFLLIERNERNKKLEKEKINNSIDEGDISYNENFNKIEYYGEEEQPSRAGAKKCISPSKLKGIKITNINVNNFFNSDLHTYTYTHTFNTNCILKPDTKETLNLPLLRPRTPTSTQTNFTKINQENPNPENTFKPTVPIQRLSHRLSDYTPKFNTNQTLPSVRTPTRKNTVYDRSIISNKKKSIEKFKKLLKILSRQNYDFFINLLAFFTACINYNLLNSYIDKYSYSNFSNKTSFIFSNGFIIYVTESISLITFKFFKKKLVRFPFLDLIIILLLAVSLTIIQICILNNYKKTMIFFLIIQKIFSMYLCLLITNKLEKSKDFIMYKNRSKMTYLSQTAMILSNLIIYNFQYAFLILASFYYLIFLLIIKIII